MRNAKRPAGNVLFAMRYEVIEMRICLFLLFLLASLASPQQATAQSFDVHAGMQGYLPETEGNRQLLGRLSHRPVSGNERGLAAHRILLDIIDANGIVATAFTTTDKNGAFTFKNINGSSKLSFRLRTHFSGADFSSTPFQFAQKRSQTRNLVVFDHSNQTDLITIDLSHYRIFAEEGRHIVDIEQSFIISNRSRTAYSSTHGLRLPLPKRHLDPQAPENDYYSIEEGFVVIHKPILPNQEFQVVVTYSLPRTLGRVRVKQRLPTTVKQLAVMLHPATMTARNDLIALGNKSFSGLEYSVYVSDKERPVGNNLSLQIGDVPGGFGLSEALLLVLAMAILIGAVLLVKKHSAGKTQYEVLLTKLQQLDKAFADGSVEKANYDSNRQILLSHLTELKRRQNL